MAAHGRGSVLRGEARRLGLALYRALFRGPVGELWQLSLGTVPGEASRLDLRIVFELEENRVSKNRVSPLLSVPWEILFDGRDFLSRRRRTPILREVGDLAEPSPVSLPSPLRVLCIVATPEDQRRLDLESELREIEQAAHSRRGVEVITRRPASLVELSDMVRGGEFHVLHFAGHGQFDQATGDGALVLRGEDGKSCPVPGRHLVEVLKDQPLRLAVLNACETARTSFTAAGHPFAGVATALLQAIPAVVAMQFPIEDRQAIAFAASLYRRLLDGEPLELAVTEARLTLLGQRPRRLDWVNPAVESRDLS